MRDMLLFLVINTVFPTVRAQQDSTWLRYGDPRLVLHAGVHSDFRSFRMNAPSFPLASLMNDQGAAVQDMRIGGKVFTRDSAGVKQEVALDRQWGFTQNNAIYIRAGNGFYRIGMMGTLCHVLFEQDQRGWDPGWYPYGSGSTVRTVQQQCVLDMETGAFKPFTAATLEQLLARDEVLKFEWDAVPPKKRGQEILVLFLRRYNERHPLYFPP